MAAANKSGQEEKITALYGRLSDDDGVDIESNSIANQRTILQDYARKNGYLHPQFFCDDGVSGTTFERPGFKEMDALVEAGKVATVIVKDLSRFGRNYLEVGRYLEVVYPTLGVKFIAIQENVDTLAGTGTEMMPFHNIFNEWYAAQTSKKIRAVWAMKASKGKRISSAVPYGYVKDPDDHEKWHIDEPAAQVVRKIYALCLAGRGPQQIANQLEDERIICPTAYKLNAGRPGSHLPPADPYIWSPDTVARILANHQYTGCTVNFKTTTVSYKVHKEVHKPEDEWQIIPNTQEPIIDENTRLWVQELRSNKEQKETVMRKKELQAAKNQLEQARRREAEIDRIISRIYEDNISGKISDERFSKMSAAYEAEQKELEKSITDCEERLREADKAAIDLRMLLNGLREFSMVRELTPTIVNTLIQRIEIHNNDKSSGHCYVKVDIYFTAVGMIDIPTKQELERLRADYLKRMQSA